MKYLFLILAFVFNSSFASSLSVDLQNIALPDLVRVVFNDILHESYVVDSSLIEDQKAVSFVIRSADSKAVKSELTKLVESRGYRVVNSGNVSHFLKAGDLTNDEYEVFVYRPSFRSVQYLLELSQSLFKQGSFISRGQAQSNMTYNQLGAVGASGVMSNMSGVVPGQIQHSPLVSQNLNQGLNMALQVDTDTIVFKGTQKDVKRLKSLYAQLDMSPGELLVKAVVFEVQTGRKEASAVDLALSLLSGKLGISFDSSAASSSGLASFKLSAKGLDLSAVVDALSTDDRFRSLTSPRLRVKSGSSARFSVGNETPILSSVSYDTNGKPIQSVEYKSSGVIFELKPYIRESVSDCKVTQQISSFVPTTNGVNNSPTLIKRELSTEITVADGQIILLGGLNDEKKTDNSSWLPFLPDWLKSRRSEVANTEVVLMLQAERLNNGI